MKASCSEETAASHDRSGAILKAATALFGERGYHSVGMDDIGTVVGVSGPALYRHFASKAALLASAIEHEGADLLAEAQRVIATAPSPRDALESLIRQLTWKVLADDTRFLVTYLQQERGVPKEAKARLVECHRRYVEQLAALLGDIRPDLRADERQLRTEAVLGLINSSVLFVTTIEPKTVSDSLVVMGMAVLVDG